MLFIDIIFRYWEFSVGQNGVLPWDGRFAPSLGQDAPFIHFSNSCIPQSYCRTVLVCLCFLTVHDAITLKTQLLLECSFFVVR
jgi:hypothetical protein